MKKKNKIMIAVAALLAVAIFFYNYWRQQETKKWVEGYLEEYAEELSRSDIQMLSDDLAGLIDKKIALMETDSISEEDLQQLLMLIKTELETKTYNISESDLKKISSAIAKEAIAHNAANDEMLKECKLRIDAFGKQLQTIIDKEKIQKIMKSDIHDLALTNKNILLISEQLSMDVVSLRGLLDKSISELESRLIDNMAALQEAAATKKSLEKTNEFLADAFNAVNSALEAEESNRNTAVKNAYNALEAAINQSGENVSSDLREAQETLKQSISEESRSQLDALSAAKEILGKDIMTVNAELDIVNSEMEELNNIITSVRSEMYERDSELSESLLGFKTETANSMTELEQKNDDLKQAITEASDSASIELKEAQKALQELIDGSNTNMSEINKALENADAALSQSIFDIRSDMESKDNKVTQDITNISQQITSIQGGMETYTWQTMDGVTTLIVSIPEE